MGDDNDIELIEISNNNDKNEKKTDNPIYCPICNNNLTGFSENVIQSHVNRCLDGPTLIQKRKSFSNKIQSTITSYMNISSSTQKSITSYMKISSDNNKNTKTDNKYFNNSSKKTNIHISKQKSFSGFNESTRSENNKKLIRRTNSSNENLNKSVNYISLDNESEDTIFEESYLQGKSLSNPITKNNGSESSKLEFPIEIENNYLTKNQTNDKKENNNIPNKSLNIPNKSIQNNKNKKVETQHSETNIPFILEDIDNEEDNEEENKTINSIVNEKKEKDYINKKNNEAIIPFTLEDEDNNESIMSFDLEDIINNSIDISITKSENELERKLSDVPINDLNINDNNINNDSNDASNDSKENKKRKRKEKKNKEAAPKMPRKRKMCPFFKRVQNTQFVVDAFSYGKIENCTSYFLSHFHSDHYGGITKKYDYGPIYCSKVTANLLIELIGVDKQFVHPLELNKEYNIDGVKVTLIDANHCPGAVLFLFSVPIGKNEYFNALHTGDFRASIDQLLNPAIQGLKNSFLDILYLDTTYLQPEHIFPSQEIVINSVLDVLKNIIFEGKTIKEYNNLEKKKKLNSEYRGGLLRYFNNGKNNPNNKLINDENIENININEHVYNKKRALILVGTYLIGKEKVFVNIAKYLKSKIYASSKKKRILECLNDETISALLTTNPDEANVHVLNMGQLGIESVNSYYNMYKDKYDMVIAFRPTGWVFKPKKSSKRQLEPDSKKILEEVNNLRLKPTYYNKNVSIWGIPYSEHSSFLELENFIRVLSSIAPIRNIQPTVNVRSFNNQNEESKKYWYWFDTWRQNPLFI